jgi:hypothetical protein
MGAPISDAMQGLLVFSTRASSSPSPSAKLPKRSAAQLRAKAAMASPRFHTRGVWRAAASRSGRDRQTVFHFFVDAPRLNRFQVRRRLVEAFKSSNVEADPSDHSATPIFRLFIDSIQSVSNGRRWTGLDARKKCFFKNLIAHQALRRGSSAAFAPSRAYRKSSWPPADAAAAE